MAGDAPPSVDSLLSVLEYSEKQLADFERVMLSELEAGLANKKTSLREAVAYLTKSFTGSESGQFLGIDIGGTNFRVLLCTLSAGSTATYDISSKEIPSDVLCGTVPSLFDFMADAVYVFIKEKNLLDLKLKLGFTFSFPVHQDSISNAILETWTKSFKIQGGVGEDAAQHLRDALQRKHCTNVSVVAIINDATATLVAGNFVDKDVAVGVILGTGTNAGYYEKASAIEKYSGNEGLMAVQSDWGALGDNGILDPIGIYTKYDKAVDAMSNYVGSYTFDKVLGGLCFPDTIMEVLRDLQTAGLWAPTVQLPTKPFQFRSAQFIAIEEGADLTFLGWTSATPEDTELCRRVILAVTRRNVHLFSAALGVLLRRVESTKVAVAIDGSFFQHHALFRREVDARLKEIVPEKEVRLLITEDASGKGAALVAALL